MDEVGAALIAIALVLCAVFVPSAFITGISGQFYRQFALTIAGATVISLIVSLTLVAGAVRAAAASRIDEHAEGRAGGSGRCAASSAVSICGFDKLAQGYGWLAARVVRYRRDHAAWSMPASSPSASTNSARRRSASSRSSTAAI